MVELIPFLQEAEGLKSVTRTAWTGTGRRESTAEHSWRLSLFVMLAAEDDPEIDAAKAVKLALIHDLGETYGGDVSAATLPDAAEKLREERGAMERLGALLPERQGRELLALWEEYNACQTPEARLVKALDKAETILQHNQGENPPDFDYAFNLTYGAAYFKGRPALEELREMIDGDTRSHLGDEHF